MFNHKFLKYLGNILFPQLFKLHHNSFNRRNANAKPKLRD